MEKFLQMQQALLRSRRLPLVVIVFTLIVLAATIAITTRQVRSRIREQIASRDGEVLHAVATMQMEQAAADIGLTDAATNLGTSLRSCSRRLVCAVSWARACLMGREST